MGSRWRDLRLHRSTLLHARMAIAVSAGISAGWLGPIGRAGAQTYWPATATYPPGNAANAGVSYQGNTELYDNKRGDNSLRWNCSALQCTRYHTSRICARCFWGDVFGRPIPDDSPSFFCDSLVQVVARTYLLSREISMVQSLRQWQVAGDLIGIGGAYYTSQKIFGDPDQGGTLLLAPGQGPINVLGKAYVRSTKGA